jgi:hypothetical protein
MKKLGWFFAGAFALGLMIGIQRAQADDQKAGVVPPEQMTVAENSTILGVPTDRLYLNYFAVFHGTSIGSPSYLTVDRTGATKPTNLGMYFDSTVTAAYMLDKNTGVGPYVPFFLLPVRGGDFIMGDAGATIFNMHTIQTGGLNVATNLIIQGPSSTLSQQNGMTVGFKTTPAVRYVFTGSRFTVGAWTEAKYYAGVDHDKTFKLYGQPYVSYQLLPHFSANLGYEMEAHHNVGQPGYFNFTNYQTDLLPGFVWIPSSHLVVNPYLQLFTGNKVTFDTTAFGAVISATL